MQFLEGIQDLYSLGYSKAQDVLTQTKPHVDLLAMHEASPVRSAAVLAVVVIVVISTISTIRQYLRLRHFKGPPLAAFSQLWLIRAVCSGRTHLDFWEVCEKYGPITRVGPHDLITSDPDLMKHILQVRTRYERSDWYDGLRFNPRQDNVLSMRDNALHTQLRTKMAAGYSGKEIEGLEGKIDENVLKLTNLLETKYASANKPFDFGRKASFFTLDVISELAFGAPFGNLTTDSDLYDHITIMEEVLPAIIITSAIPWLLKIFRLPLLDRLLPSEKDERGFGRIMAIAKNASAERFGPNKKVKKDMLGSFVAHGLTQKEANSETQLQILVGSDTTATALKATLLYIVTNPRVYNSLRAEIDAKSPSLPVITDTEARDMPYLQAVIKEGLRMHPPVAGQMSKVVPKGGDTFKGMFIPEGTHIGYCGWGIFRRTDFWGEDASEFRPERWLDASPQKLKDMEGVLELVFGFGKWQCLGKNIAMMELNKVFAELLRRFDLTLVDPMNPWHSVNCGAFLQSKLWMRAHVRSPSTK